MRSYYFDYNASTPVCREVKEAMEPFFTGCFGNASSFHHVGQASAKAMRGARKKIAALLGAKEENEIIFTSGGTESNNAAIRSALATSGKKEIVTSAVEHSSIRRFARQLQKEGYVVHQVGVDGQGRLNEEQFQNVLSERTAIVSLMMANNETGVIFPVEKMGKLVKERGILFHVDAVQTVGKCSLKLSKSSIDFLSLSGHKLYGPKGAGVLYARKDVPYQSFIFGGAQERGRRAGTENVPGIVGLGAACAMAHKDLEKEIKHIGALRDHFEKTICSRISGVSVNGGMSERLCTTSNLCFRDTDGEALLIALDQKGICASSGSACMSGSREPSPVLKAMGLSDDHANSSLRFSFGRYTTAEEIQFLVDELVKIVARLRDLGFNQHSHQRPMAG